MSKNWQLGFLGFLGIKKEENKSQQKFNSVERDRFEEV